MTTGTAIVLAAAVLGAALLLRPKPAAAPKPSGWGQVATGAVDLIKWGYGEIWGDEDDE